MIVIIVNNFNLKCQQVRVCHVCGEKAGKHSYYGGQVINAIIMTIKIIGITIIMNIGVYIITIRCVPPAAHFSGAQFSPAIMQLTSVSRMDLARYFDYDHFCHFTKNKPGILIRVIFAIFQMGKNKPGILIRSP